MSFTQLQQAQPHVFQSIPGNVSYPPGTFGQQPALLWVNGAPTGPVVDYSNFGLHKRHERIDWRKLSSVDVDRIAAQLDWHCLQENIAHITYCTIESELDTSTIDPNFIKLFKLAQLTIEYLLNSQEYLATAFQATQERIDTSIKEAERSREEAERVKKDLSTAKQESHKRKKLLAVQQQLLHYGSNSLDAYKKCAYCTKTFLSDEFLRSHMVRRHQDKPLPQSLQTGAPPPAQPTAAPAPAFLVTHEKELLELRSQLRDLEDQRRAKDLEFSRWREDERQKKETEMERVREKYLNEMRELREQLLLQQARVSNSALTAPLSTAASLNNSLQQQQQPPQQQAPPPRPSNLGQLRDDPEAERERERERQLYQQQQLALQSEIENLRARIAHSEKSSSSQRASSEQHRLQWQQELEKLNYQHRLEMQEMQRQSAELQERQVQSHEQQLEEVRRKQTKAMRQLAARSKRQQEHTQWQLPPPAPLAEPLPPSTFIAPPPPPPPQTLVSEMQSTVTETLVTSMYNETMSAASEPTQRAPRVPRSPRQPTEEEVARERERLERLHASSVIAGRLLIAHLGIVRPPLYIGEPLINNPNLLREHKQAAHAALGNALQQYGVPQGQTQLMANVFNDLRDRVGKEREVRARRLTSFQQIRDMYKQKLEVLATDRRRGGHASNPMQDTSVYRSTVEELHTNSSLLTRAAARSRSGSGNRSLERDAAAAFPTPLTYSSSPQPVHANAGAGQVLSHSYDAAGDASIGSTGALGPSYPSAYASPNLTGQQQPPYPYTSANASGALSGQPPYPYAGPPSGQIYGQPPPAPSSSGFTAPLPIGFNAPPPSAPPPAGFNLPGPAPAPPPPPRDNLGPNEQIGAPGSVQKVQGRRRVTFPDQYDDDFDADINSSQARSGMPQGPDAQAALAAQRAAAIARGSNPSLNASGGSAGAPSGPPPPPGFVGDVGPRGGPVEPGFDDFPSVSSDEADPQANRGPAGTSGAAVVLQQRPPTQPQPIAGAGGASVTLTMGTGSLGTGGGTRSSSAVPSVAGSPAGRQMQVGSPPGPAGGTASLAVDDYSNTYNTSKWGPDSKMVSSIAAAPRGGVPQPQQASGGLPQNFDQLNVSAGRAGEQPGSGGQNPQANSRSSLAGTDVDVEDLEIDEFAA